MGLVPSFCRALISLHKRVRFEGPLLTLGNQDIWADYDQLKSFFDDLGCSYADAKVIPHSSRLLSQHPEAVNYVHARTFFEMLGIKEYYDIDKFDIDAPQILHDLNFPIPVELRERFNLIIDSGTIEHIFDVRQVMENMVSMCRTSGWVVHIAPASNFMDHGFYCFSPCFFYDFYRVNGFADFSCYVLQINPDNLCEPSPYFEYEYGMNLQSLIDPQRQSLVFFAARKVHASKTLAIPTQGVYLADSTGVSQETPTERGPAVEPSYVSLTERFMPPFLIPFLRPIRPWLGAIRRSLTPRRKRAVTPPYEQLRRI